MKLKPHFLVTTRQKQAPLSPCGVSYGPYVQYFQKLLAVMKAVHSFFLALWLGCHCVWRLSNDISVSLCDPRGSGVWRLFRRISKCGISANIGPRHAAIWLSMARVAWRGGSPSWRIEMKRLFVQ